MKKLFFGFFGMFALLSVLFTFSACGPTDDDDKKKDTIPTPASAIEFSDAIGVFAGEDFALGTFTFVMQFNTEGIEISAQGEPSGTGHIMQVYIQCEKNSSLMINEGKYDFVADQKELGVGKVLVNVASAFVDDEETQLSFESGSFNVSGTAENAKFTATLTTTDGEDMSFVYEGGYQLQNQCITFYGENTTPVTKELKETKCEFAYLGTSESVYFYSVDLSGADYQTSLQIVTSVNAGTDVSKLLGDYPVKGDQTLPAISMGYAEPTSDGQNIKIYPSFIGKVDASGAISEVFYVYGGSGKIEANKITLNLISAYGSEFAVTYEGEITVTDESKKAAPAFQFAPAR